MKSIVSPPALAIALAAAAVGAPANAKPGDPVKIGEGVTIDPIIDGRLRWEHVDQDNALKTADAVTMRMRAGAEIKVRQFSFLAEAEGTLALSDKYNDTIPGNNGFLGAEPYSVVADPESVELNRLQVGYKSDTFGLTIGRQRINLDNQRFVGSVGWRQNEQTFDAVRGTGKFGPVELDATYAISQRTVFGSDSPQSHFDGNFVLAQAGVAGKTWKIKAFTHLLDYDNRPAFASKTFGVLGSFNLPVSKTFKLDLNATYATQSDYEANPLDYSANYIWAEAGATVADFAIKAGYEELGSDEGVASFQTPLATLHAFNGWADLFLTTPPNGLRDYYGSIGRKLGDFGPMKGLTAAVIYHKFESDWLGIDYGTEWNASLAFKVRNYTVLLKYANYDAEEFNVDTEKFWFQFEFAY